MNEAGFYKLSMDLRDLARKIPLHWGQVQNNKVDDKINMFDIFHYEELEKQIASLPITSQNYLRRRWYLWKCSECDEYLFYCNDNVEKNPNKYDKEYDVKINNRYHFDIKGTVVPREMRDNIEILLENPQEMINFYYDRQSTGSIIRKTKCFRILERNAKISKTKRNFSRLYPTPQKFKEIDRLRRNEIHLKAVRTSS